MDEIIQLKAQAFDIYKKVETLYAIANNENEKLREINNKIAAFEAAQRNRSGCE